MNPARAGPYSPRGPPRWSAAAAPAVTAALPDAAAGAGAGTPAEAVAAAPGAWIGTAAWKLHGGQAPVPLFRFLNRSASGNDRARTCPRGMCPRVSQPLGTCPSLTREPLTGAPSSRRVCASLTLPCGPLTSTSLWRTGGPCSGTGGCRWSAFATARRSGNSRHCSRPNWHCCRPPRRTHHPRHTPPVRPARPSPAGAPSKQ
mmetsp:Transcript_106133/g.342320  ORF Transcript_106133/g.342320 Transcript_106133/m.342320 type:complete len:202 (-) Transcript_106133:361-966(-)